MRTREKEKMYLMAMIMVVMAGAFMFIATDGVQETDAYAPEGTLFMYEGITYEIIDPDEKVVSIYGTGETSEPAPNNYLEIYGDLVIPSKVEYNGDEFTVGKIGNAALSYGQFTSVVLPDTIEEYEANCLYGCPNLLQVTINSSADNIESWCSRSPLLERFIVKEGCMIDQTSGYLFAFCPNLTTLGHIEGVIDLSIFNELNLGQYSFQDCTSIKNVILPSTVKGLDTIDMAFRDCPIQTLQISTTDSTVLNHFVSSFDIEELIINANIEVGTFANMKSLKTVVINGNVSSVPENAFIGCSNLEYITVLSSDPNLILGNACFQTGTNTIIYVSNASSVLLDNGDDGNAARTAANGTNTGNLYLAATKPSVGQTFTYQGITYKVLPGQQSVSIVGSTGHGVFNDFNKASNMFLTGIDDLQLPSTVYKNGLAYTVTKIEDSAFYGGSMTSISLPSTVTEIGDSIITNCPNLTKICVNSNITAGYGLFPENPKLEQVIITNDYTIAMTDGDGFMKDCPLLYSFGQDRTAIDLSNVSGISYQNDTGIFDGGNAAAYVKIASADQYMQLLFSTKISNGTAYMFPELKTVEFLANPVSSAFENNTCITKVILGKDVTSIGVNAFKGCSSLETIESLNTASNPVRGNGCFNTGNNTTVSFSAASSSWSASSAYDGSSEISYVGVVDIGTGFKVSDMASVTFNWTAQEPGFTLESESGSIRLTKDIDYVASYYNNINAGTATILVQGINNYSGYKTVNFTIDKKPIVAEFKPITSTSGIDWTKNASWVPYLPDQEDFVRVSESKNGMIWLGDLLQRSILIDRPVGTYEGVVCFSQMYDEILTEYFSDLDITYINASLTVDQYEMTGFTKANDDGKILHYKVIDPIQSSQLDPVPEYQVEIYSDSSRGDYYMSILEGDIVIPSTVEYDDGTGTHTYTVTRIADGAFGFAYGITSLTIPETVVEMSYKALNPLGMWKYSLPNCQSITFNNIPTGFMLAAFYNYNWYETIQTDIIISTEQTLPLSLSYNDLRGVSIRTFGSEIGVIDLSKYTYSNGKPINNNYAVFLCAKSDAEKLILSSARFSDGLTCNGFDGLVNLKSIVFNGQNDYVVDKLLLNNPNLNQIEFLADPQSTSDEIPRTVTAEHSKVNKVTFGSQVSTVKSGMLSGLTALRTIILNGETGTISVQANAIPEFEGGHWYLSDNLNDPIDFTVGQNLSKGKTLVWKADELSSLEFGFTIEIDEDAYLNSTGEQLTPAFKVIRDSDGLVLAEGADYTFEYGENIGPGTGSITVTGIIAYKDTLTKQFEIGKVLDEYTISIETSNDYRVSLESQTVLEGDPMVAVIISSIAGSYWPEGYIEESGIQETLYGVTVVRDSPTQLMIYGIPTANRDFGTLPSPTHAMTVSVWNGEHYKASYTSIVSDGSTIEPILVSASEGYEWPSDYLSSNSITTSQNGITIVRTSDKILTISGTPTTDVDFGSLPEPDQCTYPVYIDTDGGDDVGLDVRYTANEVTTRISNGDRISYGETVKVSMDKVPGEVYKVYYSIAGQEPVEVTHFEQLEGGWTAMFSMPASAITISYEYVDSTDLTDGYIIEWNATPLVYNGSAQTQPFNVRLPEGIVLTSEIDYTYSFTDNVDAGTAKLTVTGIGDYSGTITSTFEILKVPITLTPSGIDSTQGSNWMDLTSSSSPWISRLPSDTVLISGTDWSTYGLTLELLAGYLRDGSHYYIIDENTGSFKLPNGSYEGYIAFSEAGKQAISEALSGYDITFGTADLVVDDSTSTEFVYEGVHYKLIENTNNLMIFSDGNYYEGNTLKAGPDTYNSTLEGDIRIPATIGNGNQVYTVTEVGQYAFMGATGITSITFPDTINKVTNIVDHLKRLTNLRSITFEGDPPKGLFGMFYSYGPNSAPSLDVYFKIPSTKTSLNWSGWLTYGSSIRTFGNEEGVLNLTNLWNYTPSNGNVFGDEFGIEHPAEGLILPDVSIVTFSDYYTAASGNTPAKYVAECASFDGLKKLLWITFNGQDDYVVDKLLTNNPNLTEITFLKDPKLTRVNDPDTENRIQSTVTAVHSGITKVTIGSAAFTSSNAVTSGIFRGLSALNTIVIEGTGSIAIGPSDIPDIPSGYVWCYSDTNMPVDLTSVARGTTIELKPISDIVEVTSSSNISVSALTALTSLRTVENTSNSAITVAEGALPSANDWKWYGDNGTITYTNGSYSLAAGEKLVWKADTTIDLSNPGDGISIDIAISDQTYDGSALTPSFTVTMTQSGQEDVVLTPEVDYTYSFSNNTNAGTATVSVTGIGSYDGTISQNFNIDGKQVTIGLDVDSLIYGQNVPSWTSADLEYLTISGLIEDDANLASTIRTALDGKINTTTDGTDGKVGTYLTLSWNSDAAAVQTALAGTEGLSNYTFVCSDMPTVTILYTVSVTEGTSFTLSSASQYGNADTAIESIVVTAGPGCFWPENYLSANSITAEVNGVTITRTSSLILTISGSPTADRAFTLAEPTTTYTVSIVEGSTYTVSLQSQQVTRGDDMTSVTITAKAGYHWPEEYISTNFASEPVNGITISRTSDSVLTISGTPTDSRAFGQLPAATQKTSINVADISIDWSEGYNGTFDGNAKVITVSGAGVDNLVITYENLNDETTELRTVGTYRVTISLAETAAETKTLTSSGIPVESTARTLEITKAEVTITLKDIEIAYGSVPAWAQAYEVSGFIDNENLETYGITSAMMGEYIMDGTDLNLDVGQHNGAVLFSDDAKATIRMALTNYDVTFVDEKNLTVSAIDVSAATAVEFASNGVYTGAANTPVLASITIGGVEFTGDQLVGLTMNNADRIGAGSYDVTVTGTGNFSGSKTFTDAYTVDKATVTVTVKDVSVGFNVEPVYHIEYGAFIDPDTEQVVDDTGLTYVTGFVKGDAVYGKLGTYPVTAAGLASANYDFEYVAGTITVTLADIEDGWTFGEVPAQVYSGKDIEPEVEVKIGNNVLVKGTDYLAVYNDNREIGIGYITITPISGAQPNYGGAKVIEFAIAYAQDTDESETDIEYSGTTDTVVIKEATASGKNLVVNVVTKDSADADKVATISFPAGTTSAANAVISVINTTDSAGIVASEDEASFEIVFQNVSVPADQKVTVKVPFKLPAGAKASFIKVFCKQDANGASNEEMTGVTYSGGFVTFETTHNSAYLVTVASPELFTVSFVDGTKITDVDAEEGSSILLPTAEGQPDKDFAGWYVDLGSANEKYVGKAGMYYNVNGNVTISAKYTDTPAPAAAASASLLGAGFALTAEAANAAINSHLASPTVSDSSTNTMFIVYQQSGYAGATAIKGNLYYNGAKIYTEDLSAYKSDGIHGWYFSFDVQLTSVAKRNGDYRMDIVIDGKVVVSGTANAQFGKDTSFTHTISDDLLTKGITGVRLVYESIVQSGSNATVMVVMADPTVPYSYPDPTVSSGNATISKVSSGRYVLTGITRDVVLTMDKTKVNEMAIEGAKEFYVAGLTGNNTGVNVVIKASNEVGLYNGQVTVTGVSYRTMDFNDGKGERTVYTTFTTSAITVAKGTDSVSLTFNGPDGETIYWAYATYSYDSDPTDAVDTFDSHVDTVGVLSMPVKVED